jgi:hypothetical protein
MFWLTQQFEACEVGRDTSAGTIGERAPTLNVSAANNNRAGSFMARNLSPVRTFERIFSICYETLGNIDFRKSFAKILKT